MKCRTLVQRLLLAILALTPVTAFAQGPVGATSWQAIPNSELEYAVFGGEESPQYAVRNARGELLVSRALDHRIHLRDGAFDPLKDEIPTPAPLLRARAAGRLFVVQYQIPGVPMFREALEGLGVQPLQFMPQSSDLVRMDPNLIDQVRTLPFVRWVGAYHPGWRLDAETRSALLNGALGTVKYNILTTRANGAEKAALAEVVTNAGGTHEPVVPFGRLFCADLSAATLVEVLHRDELLFLDPWGAMESDLDIARVVGGANAIEAAAGYDGTGVVGEVMDTGVLVGHLNYTTPTIHGSNSTDTSHGTSVYGIVFGTGNHDATARGILPNGTGLFAASSSFLNNSAARYTHTAQLTQPPYEAVFQTNSTGSPRTFFYTTLSSEMDGILFDNDFVILQSQSNAGNQDSRPQAWSKNIISVGGIRHYNTATTADDAWLAGGSIGPAQDGRIKPDISMFYDNIRTTSNGGTTSYTNSFGGTSGATPLTAGHVGLLHQMYADGIFGNTVTPGAGVFANRPHMTTAKALLLNTAAQYTFSGAAHDLTRVHQGWGRPNVENAWNLRNRMIIVDETDLIAPFQTNSYTVNVLPSDPELRVTMIFADPAGNPAATQARINDLSLRVTSPTGTVYWGNNGLLANNYSTSGGSSNSVDTVENVLINGPAAGFWTVEVIAMEINQDSHVETPAVDADYALIISGADLNLIPPTPPTGQPNSGIASLTVPGAANAIGQGPTVGNNGPFSINANPAAPIVMTFEGQPNQPFLLAFGPVNANNLIIPTVGSLDLGSSPLLSDVSLILNGLAPTTFLDGLAVLDASGSRQITFAAPPSLSGSTLGGLQAAIVQQFGITLSAATKINVN